MIVLGEVYVIDGRRYVASGHVPRSKEQPNEAVALVELRDGEDAQSLGRSIASAKIDLWDYRQTLEDIRAVKH